MQDSMASLKDALWSFESFNSVNLLDATGWIDCWGGKIRVVVYYSLAYLLKVCGLSEPVIFFKKFKTSV